MWPLYINVNFKKYSINEQLFHDIWMCAFPGQNKKKVYVALLSLWGTILWKKKLWGNNTSFVVFAAQFEMNPSDFIIFKKNYGNFPCVSTGTILEVQFFWVHIKMKTCGTGGNQFWQQYWPLSCCVSDTFQNTKPIFLYEMLPIRQFD